jgi:ankyrin repeat protein
VWHLLAVGATLNCADENGLSPLHWCASFPQSENLIPMMLARGLSVNILDNFGRTPLHLLAALGRINGVTCLLHHSADVTIRETTADLLAIDFAILHGHDDVVKVLAAYGAIPTNLACIATAPPPAPNASTSPPAASGLSRIPEHPSSSSSSTSSSATVRLNFSEGAAKAGAGASVSDEAPSF